MAKFLCILTLFLACATGSIDARNQLFHHFQPLALTISREFRPRPTLSREDLEQEAAVALLESFDRYDPEKGEPEPYLATCIRNRLMEALGDSFPLRRPPKVNAQKALLERAKDQLSLEGKETSVKTLSSELGWPEVKTQTLLTLPANPLSFDALEEDIHSSFGQDYDALLDQITLEQAAQCLTFKERQVIYRLFYERMTHIEIAHSFGVCPEAVCKTKARALNKLRKEMQN